MWDIFVLYELVIDFKGQCTTAISIHYVTGFETSVIPIKMLSLQGLNLGTGRTYSRPSMIRTLKSDLSLLLL